MLADGIAARQVEPATFNFQVCFLEYGFVRSLCTVSGFGRKTVTAVTDFAERENHGTTTITLFCVRLR
jgi:hypothetical protein